MASTHAIKCVVVGDEVSGTTRMLISMTGGSFSDEYIPTMFENYSLPYNEDCTIDLCDTGGADGCDRFRVLSYPQTDVVIISFSLVDSVSFENVKDKWLKEVREYLKTTPIILVGNKLDLREDKKTVEKLKDNGLSPITYFQGLKLAKEIRAVKYLECSAMNNKGVQKVSDEIYRIASIDT